MYECHDGEMIGASTVGRRARVDTRWYFSAAGLSLANIHIAIDGG